MSYSLHDGLRFKNRFRNVELNTIRTLPLKLLELGIRSMLFLFPSSPTYILRRAVHNANAIAALLPAGLYVRETLLFSYADEFT